jgi:single-stranded-DNA-specific exonuclease
MKNKTWEILNEEKKDVIDILLQNRGLKTKEEKEKFFKPTHPLQLTLLELQIDKTEIKKAKERIEKAKETKEKVIVYGDYDADGVTATAIMWEALHKFGLDVLPYIPDRFKEGYGINTKSIQELKVKNEKLKLIVTVDNGIVANDAIEAANKLGIDVIVADHHAPSASKPNATAIIHTTQIAGSAVAWILARELGYENGLELTAIGTIADQMPLTHANRSFAKHGLAALRTTKRAGLIELMQEAAINLNEVGTYEVNYIIAPRINSMGRLAHAIDSLRLLCTTDKIVEEISVSVRTKAKENPTGIIFISDKSYHEGIIGLAAGKLVEEFYRPAIVISIGEEFSKGSARSILGFNIVEAIREHSALLTAHGGHTMAAGFTIETSKLEEFRERINSTTQEKLTEEMLNRKLKIDTQLDFNLINWELVHKLKEFEPTGLGNPGPTFVTYNAEIADAKLLGKDKTHLKMKLKSNGKFFDAIGFGMGGIYEDLKKNTLIDIVYSVEENEWNGVKSLQLRLKDLKYTHAENNGVRDSKKNKRKSKTSRMGK